MFPSIPFQRPAGGPLRGLAARLVAVVLAKLALLLLIWWAAAPATRPDTRPAAIARHLAPAHPASTRQGPP
jgi:hypothetical protein